MILFNVRDDVGSVLLYIITVIFTKDQLVMDTDLYHFQSPFFSDESCEEIYNEP